MNLLFASIKNSTPKFSKFTVTMSEFAQFLTKRGYDELTSI
jgi:hypothetical protein